MENGLCECGCGMVTNKPKYDNKKYGTLAGESCRFIKGHNARIRTGEKSPNWKGGANRKGSTNWRGRTIIIPGGYRKLRVPEHPRADSRGYVYEHLVIAEKALGEVDDILYSHI